MENTGDFSRHEMIQPIIDDFKKTAFRILKKGIKQIDATHSDWEQGYDSLAREIFSYYNRKLVGGEDASTRDASEEPSIEVLAEHIDDFQGFDLAAFLTRELGESEAALMMNSDLPEAYISLDLKRDFWKVIPDDKLKRRFYKRSYQFRTSSSNFIKKITGKGDRGWGKQYYQPRLLTVRYLFLPVLRKVMELLEKRMREHARQFNYLHLTNETEFKDLILKSVSGYHPQEETNKQDEPEVTKEKTQENPDMTQIKSYSEELQDYFGEGLHALEEMSSIAGTPLLNESVFSVDETERIYLQFTKDFNKYSSGWKSYFEGEGDDWVKDLDIILLQLQTQEITGSTILQIEKKVNDIIGPRMDQLLANVKSSFDRIKDAENSPDLRDKILDESRVSLRNLRQKELPELTDAIINAQLLKALENYSSRINFRFNSLADEFFILQKSNIESIPPQVSIKRINLKKIIQTEYLGPLKIENEKFIAEADNLVSNILRSLNEIGHMIQVNLESALELLDEENVRSGKKDNASKFVTDGLDRIYNKVERLKPESISIPEVWGNKITEISYNFIQGVNKLIDNENILNLILRQTRAEASKSFTEVSRTFRENVRRSLVIIWRIVAFGITGARTSYEHLSKIAGVGLQTDSEKQLMNFLFITRDKIGKLPFVYQRLFRFEALKDRSIFAGRTEESERLSESFQLWKSGYFASVAVVGEKGSGRTSFINIAEIEILKSVKHFRVNLPKEVSDEKSLLAQFRSVVPNEQPASLDELEKVLLDSPARIVIMVEDLQNIFIRTVKGFDLIERFLLMISRTAVNVFWVITGGKYFWSYLDKVVSIKRYFQDVIYLDDLDEAVMKDIILKRHRLSGYDLEYKADEYDLSERRYKRLTSEEDRQEYLETACFRRLHDHSKGNISVALLLWQLSVDSIKSDKVIISDDLYLDANFLSMLEEDELFTLEAIIEMEVLTIAEHAEIFYQDIRSSELIMLRLMNKGVLFRTGDGFQIHSLLYKQTIKVLDSRNILK